MLAHAFEIQLVLYLDTGTGKHRQLVNVSDVSGSLGPDYCHSLLGLYVFTGKDCTSSFKCKGKTGTLKKLEKNPRFHKVFKELGDTWTLCDETIKDIEHFTCLMCGYNRDASVNKVRSKLLRRMVGENDRLTLKPKIDLVRLPPCQATLISHIHRVNH